MVPYGYIPQEDLESEARRIRLPSHVLPAIITPALSGTGFPAVPLVAETQYRDSDQRRLPYRSEAQPNTMSAVKRTVADTEEEAVSSSKHSKKENPEDFSNAVKKRLQSSSRTGQACDRCKVSLEHHNPNPNHKHKHNAASRHQHTLLPHVPIYFTFLG